MKAKSNRPMPSLGSDAEAEQFVETADLFEAEVDEVGERIGQAQCRGLRRQLIGEVDDADAARCESRCDIKGGAHVGYSSLRW